MSAERLSSTTPSHLLPCPATLHRGEFELLLSLILSFPQVQKSSLHPGASSAKGRLEEESCSLILLPGCSNSPVIATHFVLFLEKKKKKKIKFEPT